MRKSALLSFVLTAALVTSCSQAENKNALPKPTVAPTQTAAANVSTPASPNATPFVSNAAAPPRAGGGNPPPKGDEIPRAAEFDGYPYSYKKDDTKTVATFAPCSSTLRVCKTCPPSSRVTTTGPV